jgi:DNA-binding MarR family transcriptional regulator
MGTVRREPGAREDCRFFLTAARAARFPKLIWFDKAKYYHHLEPVLDDAVHAILSAYPTIHSACRRRQLRDPASGKRVSDHQAGILEHLDAETPITVSDLAARLRVTSATASLQLTQLARLRLVTRERDQADARRVQVRLTEAGVRLKGLRSLLDPERVRQALTQLHPSEQEAVVAGLRLLAGAVGGLSGESVQARRSPRSPRRTPRR